ncbi:MAG: glycosyltransferase family 4 protein [Hyphomicrobium sp.]
MSGTQTAKRISERISLVAENAVSVVRLRSELLLEFARQGHRVLCVTGPATGRDVRHLRELGAQHRSVAFDAPGLRLITDWRVVTSLAEVFDDWQPNIVMGFGPRALTCAAIAAKRANVRRVVSFVTGLQPNGRLPCGERRFMHAMKSSDAAVFHNDEDRRTLQARELLPLDVAYGVVPGAGVDIRRIEPQALPPTENGVVYLMLSRLERQRGVLDYALAARSLKDRAPASRFLLAGPESTRSDAISVAAVLKASDGVIEYLGDLADVRPALAGCHVFVYPSHAEGMPRAVLEALAAGRPVITTDTPGCRETIDERVSGCLVAARDPVALARAMESFVQHADLIPAMARAARLKAERRFDAVAVNRKIIEMIGL